MRRPVSVKMTIALILILLLSCCQSSTKPKSATATDSVVKDKTPYKVSESVSEEIAVDEIQDTAGLFILFRDFLALFKEANTAIPPALAEKFLYRVDEIEKYLNDQTDAMSDIELKTKGIRAQNKNYYALECLYGFYGPGHSSESSYLVTCDPGGRVIDTHLLGKSEEGDYVGTTDAWKFLNDSVFIKFSLQSESSLKLREGEQGPPEYVTETDTVGDIWKYIITQKGKVMLMEEYLQEDR